MGLACRIFTDMTFEGFADAGKPYELLLSTFRSSEESHQAQTLKDAERKLLDALAEDANFGLAYYNLGVVYTRQAHAATLAELAPQALGRPGMSARRALVAARRDAARVAFWNAIERDPKLWQAHYALAVTQFQAIDSIELGHCPRDSSREPLEQVIRGCRPALALCSSDAHAGVVHDLMGMAEVRLGTADGFAAGIRDHRAAVVYSWKELCRAERLTLAHPGTGDRRVEQARDNATAALHNLALAYAHRAMLADRFDDYALADRIFKAAIRLDAGLPERAAASWFERGRALEQQGSALMPSENLRASHEHHGSNPRRADGVRSAARAAGAFKLAADAFEHAADLKVTYAEYPGSRARALGRYAEASKREDESWPGFADVQSEIAEQARRALRELAPALRRSVAPLTPLAPEGGDRPEADRTLEALRDAYAAIGDTDGARRAGELLDLAAELRRAGRLPQPATVEPRLCREQLSAAIATLRARRPPLPPEPSPGTLAHGLDGQPVAAPGPDRDHLHLCCDQIDMALARLYAAEARLHAADGDWAPGLQMLETVIERFTARGGTAAERIVDFGLRAEYARALRHARRGPEALREIAECLRADPLCLEAHREAARIHYSMGRCDQALSAWEQALRLAPDDAYAHFKAAMCQRELAVLHRRSDAGKGHEWAAHLAQAAEHLETALARFDGYDAAAAAWARVWGGRIALERGLIGQSIVALTGALGGPADVAARLFLAEAELEAGAVDRARTAFERCEVAIGQAAPGPLDDEWAYQLSRDVIRCRLHCGQARCQVPVVGAPAGADVVPAATRIESAAADAARLEAESLRRECDLLVAATRARVDLAGVTAVIADEPPGRRSSRRGQATHWLNRVPCPGPRAARRRSLARAAGRLRRSGEARSA